MGIATALHPGAVSSIFAATGLFLASTWITLSLRIWVRITMAKSFGWDDAWLIFSALNFTGFCAVLLATEIVGGVEHVETLDLGRIASAVGMVVAVIALYLTTMVFFKIALGVFYLRFVIRPWQRWVVYVTVAINTIYGIFLFFVALLQCGNPAEYLNNELKGLCIPWGPLYGIQLTGGLINAFADWTLAILPIFILIKADMPVPAKVSAGFILLLGCTGSVISLLRLQYLNGLRPGPDFFRNVTDIAIWSAAECGTCITALASAALRPLFRQLNDQLSVIPTFSMGSRFKRSTQATTSHTRDSGAPFGDWSTPMSEHQMVDLSGSGQSLAQRHRPFRPADEAIIPVDAGSSALMQNYRVLSKMGLSREDLRGSRQHTGVADITGSMANNLTANKLVRSLSQTCSSGVQRIGSRRQKRPDISRKKSVRDRIISRPVPRNSAQIIPPTPTSGTKPQEVLSIDSRRRGSPDWTQLPSTRPWPTRTDSRSPSMPLSPHGTLF